ncbi:PIN domain nuclease [Streptomyces sp. NPDC101118]|uniref:PIN domain nuclease n=1 Tax=Streptomyces sp. NPDC101118 TaxID=3366109 RepID=UPI0038039295
MKSELYLIDKSAAARILRPKVRESWLERLRAGRISVCEPTEFEMLYSARASDHYKEMKSQLRSLYGWQPVPEDGWLKALDVQEALVERGWHRSASAADILVAVTAREHRLTVLHYDRDFDTLSGVIDVRTQWLAEPGTID